MGLPTRVMTRLSSRLRAGVRSPTTIAVGLAIVVALAACTGDQGPSDVPADAPSTSPPPVTSADSYVFTDAAGIEARLTLEGGNGELVVRNGTGAELPKPGVFVLDARDGARTTWRVVDATPVAAGQRAAFQVDRPPVPEARHIGLVVLLLGGEDLGAFVPPQPGNEA
ncbi:MAG TPA: hypothetical protein VFP41_08320 [Actinomycetota bacterium]|nr:hypothetical protein [Actinomycetota bacterium]